MATVQIEAGLSWQPLMNALGDQLLAGFGSFANLSQLEEALYIAIERDGSVEIVHLGPLCLTEAQLDSYLRVLKAVSEEDFLSFTFA